MKSCTDIMAILLNKGEWALSHSTTFLDFPCQFVPSSMILLSRQRWYREMQPLWSCDKNAAYEMVHYGWACAASWQMLRHASVWKPAVRVRGRRDAVATQHRLIRAARHATVCGPKTTVCCHMTHRAFWKAVRQQHTHVCKVNASNVVRCFCAYRLRSTFSQHCSSQCAK